MTSTPVDQPLVIDNVALCIIGAGYAGVNALNSAAHHLPRGARVVVVAREADWGGQWVDQYSYVRLHQPYPSYSAAGRRWMIDRDPHHLATLPEITRHFKETIVGAAVSDKALDLVLLFEHEYEGHAADATCVTVRATPRHGSSMDGPTRVVADRLIVATGVNTAPLHPLTFTAGSVAVHSMAPNDVLTSEWSLRMRFGPDRHKPIVVLGSGKTALDAIIALTSAFPDVTDRITCISGSGTWFLNRDRFFPNTPLGKYAPWTPTALDLFSRMIELYDGTNGNDVYRQMAKESGAFHSPWPDPQTHKGGLASEAEVEHVRRVLHPAATKIIKAHLVDVMEDGPQDVLLQLRPCVGSSAATPTTLRLPRGSFIVNCTGHLRPAPVTPVLSGHGRVLTTQMFLGFSGPSANLLTHMFYADALESWWRDFPLFDAFSSRERLANPGFGLELLCTVVLAEIMAMARMPEHLRDVAAVPKGNSVGMIKNLLAVRRFRNKASMLFKRYRTYIAPRKWRDVTDPSRDQQHDDDDVCSTEDRVDQHTMTAKL
eukprot:m.190409 g.190409  ORF g.190409 m.190409 type:complete len:543 (-) comp18030_c0_seq1:84-1712(-)